VRGLPLAVLLLLGTAAVAGAAPTGWFGMRLALDYDHESRKTVESLAIEAVFPDSPAARAHLAKGDEIVEVEGKAVSGMDPAVLHATMQRAVGEALHLRVKHSSGEIVTTVLVAAAIPDTH
jgi:C-terminal processing protease CtpA/Prc